MTPDEIALAVAIVTATLAILAAVIGHVEKAGHMRHLDDLKDHYNAMVGAHQNLHAHDNPEVKKKAPPLLPDPSKDALVIQRLDGSMAVDGTREAIVQRYHKHRAAFLSRLRDPHRFYDGI